MKIVSEPASTLGAGSLFPTVGISSDAEGEHSEFEIEIGRKGKSMPGFLLGAAHPRNCGAICLFAVDFAFPHEIGV